MSRKPTELRPETTAVDTEPVADTPTPPAPADNTPLCPRMSDEELRDFVVNRLSGRIFTSSDIPARAAAHTIPMVFCILQLGDPEFSEKLESEKDTVGCIWEYLSEAMPHGINGYPMFLSCHFMHKDDWARVVVVVNRELKRQKLLQV